MKIIDPKYRNNKFVEENTEILMENHKYNLKVDWEDYRKRGQRWQRAKKRKTS